MANASAEETTANSNPRAATQNDSSSDCPIPDEQLLSEIEGVALDLAHLAGSEIQSALNRELQVEYKTSAKAGTAPTDPVSEVDHAVEQLIREHLGSRFPNHGIVGEEVDEEPSPEQEFLWVIDPVDGTSNFVNGFPLFACSIGVLHHGRPVVGAIWCSTGHALRPGVYHARRGGPLQFEKAPITPERPNAGVSRRLAAAPGGSSGRAATWDNRVTGSAAIECVFVATGIFNSATFWAVRLWDVAAGYTLLQAADRQILVRVRNSWVPLDRFEAPDTLPTTMSKERRKPTLRDWRQPLLVGEAEVVQSLSKSLRGPSLWRRLRLRMKRWIRT